MITFKTWIYLNKKIEQKKFDTKKITYGMILSIQISKTGKTILWS